MRKLEINFPPFDSIVCDPLLEKYFVYDEKKLAPEKINVFGYAVIIENYMPEKSALFLHDKNIVAIYQDGKLVFDKIKIKNMEAIFAEFLKGKMKKGE